MNRRLPFVFGLLYLVLACQPAEPIAPHPIAFEELTPEQTGITFENTLEYKPYLNIIDYLYYYNGGGVAVGDINNDGLEDLFFTANLLPDKLYLNKGNMQFEDISQLAGISSLPTWSNGVTMQDINNDGWVDIYVSKVPMKGLFKNERHHNLLYLNNGDMTFTEVSKDYGLDFSGFSTQAAFLDYDRDGDLDMYLLNHAVHSVRSYGSVAKRSEKDSISGDRFYKNMLVEGQAGFVDVTEEAKILSSPLGFGLAITTTDINNDGWPDLYIGNDFHENDYIYINNQDGSFTESFQRYLTHSSRFTMGVDIADLNNDGALDIFTTDMMPFEAYIALKSGGEDTNKVNQIKENLGFENQYSRNHLQLKRPYGDYAEIGLLTQTYASDWSWSVLLQDFDNDGRNDIFITNGIEKRPNDLDYINYLSNSKFSEFVETEKNEAKKDLIANMPTLKINNLLFHNKGDLEFGTPSVSFIGSPSYTNGSAYSDLDNDGDLDLVLNNLNAPATILQNKTSSTEGSLSILLEGALREGSKITLFHQGQQQTKEAVRVRGFQSSSTPRVHFGLGQTTADSLHIRWSNGKEQWVNGPFKPFEKIQYAPSDSPQHTSKIQHPRFKISILPFKHIENTYLDYEREQLIPEKLSREGPAVVYKDFNGDGTKDLFFGGGRYQASQLFVANRKGGYDLQDIEDFRKDDKYEDVSATAFDADNDGDLDLYVVSGGNDFKEQDQYLMDRIYINDGKANFRRLPVFLPQTNGSVVVADDIDNDGDQDLFVGSRSIPGAYGLSPHSFIVQNNGNLTFDPVWKNRLGMVTDAVWHNIDDDPEKELLAVGDWMPVMVLDRQPDETYQMAILPESLDHYGLWNSLKVVDLNQDGREDLLLGNVGQNFKWQPSKEKPVTLYLDDFDQNEQLDPLIFYDFYGTQRPFNTKDNLGQQLPMIKKKFTSYTKFAKVESITDLVGAKEKDILEIKKITDARSLFFLKTDKGYQVNPLPKEAQFSSILDFYWEEESQSLYYFGNTNQFVTELGQQTANPAAIAMFDPSQNTFEHQEFLPLPIKINPRKVILLDDGTLLVSTNDDYVYLISKNKSNE